MCQKLIRKSDKVWILLLTAGFILTVLILSGCGSSIVWKKTFQDKGCGSDIIEVDDGYVVLSCWGADLGDDWFTRWRDMLAQG